MIGGRLVMVTQGGVFIITVVSRSFTKVSGFGVSVKIWSVVEDMVARVPDSLEDDIP
jgi:hypothetical protein